MLGAHCALAAPRRHAAATLNFVARGSQGVILLRAEAFCLYGQQDLIGLADLLFPSLRIFYKVFTRFLQGLACGFRKVHMLTLRKHCET